MLDIRTIIVTLIMTALLFGIGTLGLNVPAERRLAVRLWGGGNLIMAAGWLLLALRNTIPDWPSIVLGNTFLIAALFCELSAISLLVQRPLSLKRQAVTVLAFGLSFHFLLQSGAPAQYRIILIAGTLFVIALRVLYQLHSNRDVSLRNPRRMMQVFFLISAIASLLRLIHYGFLHTDAGSLFEPTPVQVLNFLSYYITVIGGGTAFMLMLSDLSYKELLLVASQDSLTGLRNRRSFMDAATRDLALANRHPRPLAMLMLDVDFFKSINDTRGHAAGDEVLRQLGTLLQAAMRESDLLGRYGGEEFCMLLVDVSLDDARRSAERLRQCIEEQPIYHDAQRIAVTTSIGVAAWHAGQSLDQLLSEADHALYRAKAAGRNKVMASSPRATPRASGLAI